MPGWRTIPGESPIDDISGLLVSGISTREQLNKIEAENIRKVIVKYLAAKPTRRSARFDLSWLLQLHNEMLGEVWDWAGKVRTSEMNLGVSPQEIEIALTSLLADLMNWEKYNCDLIEQAVMLHHRAVQIHPFVNGNGRWARLLANIWLKLQNHQTTAWPEAKIGTTSLIRDEYLVAIRAADDGDYTHLITLQGKYSSDDKQSSS
jgi:Fic-DOC domain mobile mystery protein B